MKNFKIPLFLIISAIFISGCSSSEKITSPEIESKYVTPSTYSPVFNTPEIIKLLEELPEEVKTDKKGLIPEIEFIAAPGMEFEILGKHEEKGYKILKVKPAGSDETYYIDSRFLEPLKSKSGEEKLSREEIIRNLKSLTGTPYEYGGSIANGIWKLEAMYEIKGLSDKWKPKGLDCSGMIFQAANAMTPRTSTEMTEFGEGLEIEGKELSEILEMIEPLDIIGYPGHVFIAIDKESVIESSPKKGVRILNSESRIKSLMKERNPVNAITPENKSKSFVIRRWYTKE